MRPTGEGVEEASKKRREETSKGSVISQEKNPSFCWKASEFRRSSAMVDEKEQGS